MLNEKKVVPKLKQEVKLKVDIVTSDDIKIYYIEKFQDITARYIMNLFKAVQLLSSLWGLHTSFDGAIENFLLSLFAKENVRVI